MLLQAQQHSIVICVHIWNCKIHREEVGILNWLYQMLGYDSNELVSGGTLVPGSRSHFPRKLVLSFERPAIKIGVWQIRKCAIDLYRADSGGAGLRIKSTAQVRIGRI